MPAPLAIPGARLNILRNPYTGRRELYDLEPGLSPSQMLVARWPRGWSDTAPPKLGMVRNGIESDDWKTPCGAGDLVVVYPKAGFESFAAFAIWFGYTLASVAVSYGLSRILAPDPPKLSGETGSRAYQFGGPATDYMPGGVIPATFGYFPVGGTVLSYVVRSKKNHAEMWLLLGLGEGPIAGVGGTTRELDGAQGASLPPALWLNDQLIGSYDPVRVNSGRLLRIRGDDEGNLSAFERGAIVTLASGAGGLAFTPLWLEDEDNPDVFIALYYRDSVQVWTRFGTENQQPIQGFNNREIAYLVQQDLRKSSQPINYPTRDEVDAVEIGFQFPEGLYSTASDDGEVKVRTVEFRTRYRRTSAGQSFGSWESVKYTAKVTSGMTRYHYVEFPARARYDVQVDRVTAQASGIGQADKSVLFGVNEIQNRDFSYPGQALLAIRILATEGLQGSRPRVRCALSGLLCHIWDGNDAVNPTFTHEWTRNPFWIALECLRNTDWGLGGYLRHAQYDLQEWLDAADWADELIGDGNAAVLATSMETSTPQMDLATGHGYEVGDRLRVEAGTVREETVVVHEVLYNTAGQVRDTLVLTAVPTYNHAQGSDVERIHERFRFDGVFDTGTGAWESVQSIVGTARGRLYKLGNKIGLVLARARPVEWMFTDGNAAEVVITYKNPRLQPNRLFGQFYDEDNLWAANPLPVQLADASLDDAGEADFYSREEQRPDTIEMRGVTRAAQVRRELLWRLQVFRDAGLSAQVKTGLRGLQARLGSVGRVAHAVLASRTVSGRLPAALSSGGSSFTIDRAVTLEGGITYGVEVKTADVEGGTNVTTRQITSAAGTYARGDTLTISGTWPVAITKGRPYAVGKYGETSTTFEVVGSRLDPEAKTYTLELEEYVESLNAA